MDETKDVNAQKSTHDIILIVWRALYWTSFILGYIILPFVQETLASGEFTLAARMKESLRFNLKYYGIMMIIGIVFTIYLAFHGYFSR